MRSVIGIAMYLPILSDKQSLTVTSHRIYRTYTSQTRTDISYTREDNRIGQYLNVTFFCFFFLDEHPKMVPKSSCDF